jgi:PAS domain S-box-containing protein
MQEHVAGVSLGIQSYLQSHDPRSLETIKAEGKEASRLLAQFKEEALRSGNTDLYSHIEKAHEDLRGSTIKLLAADQAMTKARQALTETNDALLSVLSGTMEAAIKPTQQNASLRLRAIRMAMSEAKMSPGNPTRFRKALEIYEELSRTRRASRWAEEARDQFRRRWNLAQDLQQAQTLRQSAFDEYRQRSQALDLLFQRNFAGRARLVFSSGLAYVLLAGALALFGIGMVTRSQWRTEGEFVRPLQEILQCAEAAAAGDVSRVPEHWSGDEVGQLSQAVGRLISVLARSENLVYHLAALVESSGDAIISHTLDGKILSWNKGAQRIYGYSAEEVKGRSIGILSPEDGGAEMMQNIQRIRSGERIQPFETVHQARNGRDVRTLVRVAAIYDSTHQIIGASFIAQDLTDTNLHSPRTVSRNRVPKSEG